MAKCHVPEAGRDRGWIVGGKALRHLTHCQWARRGFQKSIDAAFDLWRDDVPGVAGQEFDVVE